MLLMSEVLQEYLQLKNKYEYSFYIRLLLSNMYFNIGFIRPLIADGLFINTYNHRIPWTYLSKAKQQQCKVL